MTFCDLPDSDLLWLALRSGQAILNGSDDGKDRDIERGSQCELMQRYGEGTILGDLIRNRQYVTAYYEWCDKVS